MNRFHPASLALTFAAVAFATSFTIETRRGHAAWRARLPLVKRLIDVFGMSMAMGILAYLIVTAVAQLFQQGFLGMTVDAYGGGVLSGAAAAAAGLALVEVLATSAGCCDSDLPLQLPPEALQPPLAL